jgi:hypothetical protein
MKWLETHAYIAVWLSPALTLIGIIVQNSIGKFAPIAWHRVMLYIAFLTCLAAALTPQFELPIRYFAGFSFSMLLGYFMMTRKDE